MKDKPKTTVMVRIPNEEMQALILLAEKEDWSWGQTTLQAIKFYLRARKMLTKGIIK